MRRRKNLRPDTRSTRIGQSGFTLLEMLIVIAIIAVLATLVGPRLFGQLDSSKVTTAQAQVRMLRTALDTMRIDLGRYPTEQEGLSLLVTPPEDPALRASWFGPYLDGSVPLDPWKNPYRYRLPDTPGGVAEVYSYGPDNAEGGEGLNADISSTR
ncbi:type II secretion system protein GspG [Iodidimonas gelatinilytica]|uniref:Type II secretion system core protein G n=1 Tax=Iodidimonas gelatinilytica TaxID=1236966 RepID=A0A5A7MUL6_9PROT|nr:type II secretion system major pseudopilin GspG [Iodidimonas gelatinilytica]GEQ99013.1 type II secretion system protein GspG [Iodidimonas gelatinilytica]GEQ99781.1 type II secretion system protein GspG [Iodidimonas gelatinilytica]